MISANIMPRFGPGLDRQDCKTRTQVAVLKGGGKIRKSGGIFMEAFARDYCEKMWADRGSSAWPATSFTKTESSGEAETCTRASI